MAAKRSTLGYDGEDFYLRSHRKREGTFIASVDADGRRTQLNLYGSTYVTLGPRQVEALIAWLQRRIIGKTRG